MKTFQKLLSISILSVIAASSLAATAFAGEPMIILENFEQPEYRVLDDNLYIDNLVFEPIFNDDPADPYTDDPGIHIELEGVLTQDGRAALNWTPYLKPNFAMYKVVHDQMDPEPYYPKHGYLDYFEDPHKTGYITGPVPQGENFFRICVITDDDKRGCSNPIHIFFDEPEPFVGQHEIDPDADQMPEPNFEDNPEFDSNPRPEFEPEPEFERPRIEEDREMMDKPDRIVNEKAGLFEKIWKVIVNNLGIIVAIVTVLIAVSGFTFASKHKRKSISKYINQIDDTYSEYKMKAKRCEAELYRLKDIVDDQLKTAKIDDGAYQLLMNRIEGYMIDIQKQIVNEKFGGLPSTMKDEMFRMMEDGEITESEFEAMQKLIKRSELSASEQDNLLSTIKDFKKQDEMMKRGRK